MRVAGARFYKKDPPKFSVDAGVGWGRGEGGYEGATEEVHSFLTFLLMDSVIHTQQPH